jgi:ADP-ribose pyrophosphatase YjhB (NUDIX family)
VTERPTAVIGRRSARAILIDEDGYLVLIRRTRPGRARYWTTAGGGVEDDDGSVEAAMHRELAEELGAKATGAVQVFLVSSWSAAGLAIQHFFLARLVSLDLAQRSGPEFDDPANGAYDIDRIDLRGDDLAAVDLHPVALKMFIMDNRAALLAEAGAAGTGIGGATISGHHTEVPRQDERAVHLAPAQRDLDVVALRPRHAHPPAQRP